MALNISFYTIFLLDLWHPKSILTSPKNPHKIHITLLICTKLGETIPLLYVYFVRHVPIKALATRLYFVYVMLDYWMQAHMFWNNSNYHANYNN